MLRQPVWLLTITCLRAGVGEELFYRGYAIERLQALGLSCFWAAAIPVLIFAAINVPRVTHHSPAEPQSDEGWSR